MGLDACGKTTMLDKLASSEVVTTIPTIGLNIETASIQIPALARSGNKQKFAARVTDTGGCSKVFPLVRRMMMDDTVSGIVWVIDAADGDRLAESPEELGILLPKLGVKDSDIAPSIPILILANKIDLPDRLSSDEIRAKFDSLLENRHSAYFETCFTAPLASSGLPEAFAWLGDAITSAATGGPNNSETTTLETKKPVEKILAEMRSPVALSGNLEEWLLRAEKDIPAETLVQKFYTLDLPSWDHYTHLRLAYILLLKFGRRQGKDKIFEGFKLYIDKSGKIHGKSFHMTMTYFWVQMVHLGIASMGVNVDLHTLKAEGTEKDPRLDDFRRFLMVNQYLVDGQLWADYYSKEHLMSSEAKEGVVFPDIKGLPDVLYTTVAKPGTKERDIISASRTALV
ncbi:uncharacterized protein N0V89_008234 [Didymosphaeria variabile]|uniref:P-loop containing nucleoside triphosphate hydrolase protein n=1 Tax=Didymosphaeria variabile TaxID=1932322 RepID=A0A9W8XG16_9PLEO|nr:uncharacterized protein N0V89_008234 [Didymosphaeria variabile]KAJ4349618.1 hypothetical protein N0V89_008234 [Didymosphaeria variabile]